MEDKLDKIFVDKHPLKVQIKRQKDEISYLEIELQEFKKTNRRLKEEVKTIKGIKDQLKQIELTIIEKCK